VRHPLYIIPNHISGCVVTIVVINRVQNGGTMKYWHIRFDKLDGKYKLRASDSPVMLDNEISMFKNFDMTYDYVTKLNGSQHINQTYSRWTVNR
jgi:hypothetical protein